mmetsp:Transcript_150419/g.273739  ORF Transcript_150419/g.273739 Transcript_150419/m.273739 type:complete len:490 (-) Transcript_150419:2-1471(-)
MRSLIAVARGVVQMSKAAENTAETPSAGSSAEAASKPTAAEPAAGTKAEAPTSSDAAAATGPDSKATATTAPEEATPAGAAAGVEADAGTANGSASAEAPVEEDIGELLPLADDACEAGREAVKKVYGTCIRMKAAKNKEAKDDANVHDDAREMQLQLLLLRRCHRAMKKAVDQGKSTEALKRKAVDEEAVNMETRRHLCACLRAVACRNRNVSIPSLRRLLPNLEGYEAKEMDEDDPDDDLATHDQLQAEMSERLKRSKTLEVLRQQKSKELEEFLAYGRQRKEQDALVQKWDPMLQEWGNIFSLKQKTETPERDAAGEVSKLPTPLQLIHKKFNNFIFYDDAPELSVSVEGVASVAEGPPPEKRAKVKATADAPAICVKVRQKTGQVKKEFSLRFTLAVESLVHVAIVVPKVSNPSGLLEGLWPEDTANLQGAAYDAASGKPYYWAQVLGGLGDKILSGNPALQGLSQVSAKEVVHRLSERVLNRAK